ncbi:MAG: hypothetical protein HC836_45595 [Richelia sp. RM2_1_2]|nr:hypothetical protein [Richelia sp. RM2_1_2]
MDLEQLASVDFEALKPKSLGASELKLKTFTVVGKDLTEKQQKAGYYRQISEGDSIDGIYTGITVNDRSEYKSEEVNIMGKDGAITVVKNCGSLSRQLSTIDIGTPVRLTFTGKVKLKKGPGKGKEVQNWLVLS